MIDLFDCVFLLILAMAGVFIWRAIALREYALVAVKKHLRTLNLQLLEDAVAWQGWRLQGWHVLRVYQFEFSSMGDERYGGNISLLGYQVCGIELAAYRIPQPEFEELH